MIDERDEKIIELLSKDSRMAYTKIAEEIGISETAIRKRIQKLEKEGVIKNYTLEVDPTKMGYEIVSITGVNTAPDKFLEVANKMKKIERAKDVKITTGDHTIMSTIWAKDGEELSEIISEEIGKMEGVNSVYPAIILEEVKG